MVATSGSWGDALDTRFNLFMDNWNPDPKRMREEIFSIESSTKDTERVSQAEDLGDPSEFGMLSVKAGVDNNPKPTQADRIVGATKKMKKGGIVKKKPSRTRIAKRGFGIAKRGY
jgi:hypothetical protein